MGRMAKEPIDLKLIDGQYRVVEDKKAWIPPTEEEYARLFRIVFAIGIAGLIGGLRAWWMLHHH